MQIQYSQADIRSEIESLLSMTSGATSIASRQELNAFISQAYLKVLSDSRWVSSRRIHRANLGVDQIDVAFPPGMSEGGLLSLAYWDADQQCHVPIPHELLRPEDDVEPLNVAGGADDEAARGKPLRWHYHAGKVRLAPPNDEIRELRFEYTLATKISNENAILPVDGEAVKLLTHFLLLTKDGEVDLARAQYRFYKDRIAMLRAYQAPSEPWSLSGGRIEENDIYAHGEVPNWDLAAKPPTP